MLFHLVFHIDKEGYNGIILETFSSLQEMDDFIKNNFRNRQDVIKKYNQEIGEFCLDNRRKIELENQKNNYNRLGMVSLFFEKDLIHHKIPIIYKNDKSLLSDNLCLKKIKELLSDDNILNKLCLTKNYLLSRNELDLINLYHKFPYDTEKKEEAINFFINRLKQLDSEKKYFYFRCLMNLFKLNNLELSISKGHVSNIKYPLPSNLTLERNTNKQIESQSDDELFNQLINDSDYDKLYSIFDRDIVERDTNIFNI